MDQRPIIEITEGEPAGIEPAKFKTRIITGILYAVVTLATLYLGNDQFVLPVVASIVAGIGVREFYGITRKTMNRMVRYLGIAMAAVFPMAAGIAVAVSNLVPILGKGDFEALSVFVYIIAGFLLLYMAWVAFTPSSLIKDAAVSFMGALYTGLPLSFLVILRSMEKGLPIVIALTFSVWAADSFAYLVGSLWGRHKLAPVISPKKSWEGLFAGILGSIFIFYVARFISPLNYPWYDAVLMGVLIAVAALIGDLFESRLKREKNVKDSGDLLPGHGGMLDRIDSLLSTSLVLFLIISALGKVLEIIG